MARLIIHTDKSINDKATRAIFGTQPHTVTKQNVYRDICPSRDDAQRHIYEHGVCVFCLTKK
jgi:hypothetical protein